VAASSSIPNAAENPVDEGHHQGENGHNMDDQEEGFQVVVDDRQPIFTIPSSSSLSTAEDGIGNTRQLIMANGDNAQVVQ
jgi:hypothetical protein